MLKRFNKINNTERTMSDEKNKVGSEDTVDIEIDDETSAEEVDAPTRNLLEDDIPNVSGEDVQAEREEPIDAYPEEVQETKEEPVGTYPEEVQEAKEKAPKKVKKKGWKGLPTWAKALIISGTVLVVVALGVFIAIKIYLSRINRIEDREPTPRSQETFEPSSDTGEDTIKADEVDWDVLYDEVKRDGDIKNIILIGQDKRPEETTPARSDTMILCSINKKTNKITLVSFMRDMYVPIEGYSDNRINAAYNYGGAKLLRETIEKDFGIGIDNAIEVDFEGFIQAMTAVGDLEMELTQAEVDYLNEIGPVMNREAGLADGVWNLKAGKNMLRADQALAYARTRHVGRSDWERTDRQRRVVMAAFEKMKKMSLSEQMDLVNAVIPYFATDMTDREILGYVYYIAKEGIHVGDNLRLPADGMYTNERINNMAVLVPNLQKNSDLLKQSLYN